MHMHLFHGVVAEATGEFFIVVKSRKPCKMILKTMRVQMGNLVIRIYSIIQRATNFPLNTSSTVN